ncbi:MAG: hypothetical protein QXZ22_03455 [Sulfolobales archaeon]
MKDAKRIQVLAPGGNDIKRLSMRDEGFADALAKALTGLTIDRAVVKVTARPGSNNLHQS